MERVLNDNAKMAFFDQSRAYPHHRHHRHDDGENGIGCQSISASAVVWWVWQGFG